MIDILAYSPPSVLALNRVIYRRLAERYSLEIAIPQTVTHTGFRADCDPQAPKDPTIHCLNAAEGGPRTLRVDGWWELLERLRPRVVLLDSDPVAAMALQTSAWARLRGAKVVCQSCENIERTFSWPSPSVSGVKHSIREATLGLLNHATAPLVDHIFAISNEGVRVWERMGYAGKVSRIPLGFDETLFQVKPEAREATRKQLGLTRPTVAYFGRLIPEKGVDVLLRSLELLGDQDWQLLLDRFAEYKTDYAQQLRQNVAEFERQGRVVYFDSDHVGMPNYMNAADISVVPSWSLNGWKEQYGRVVPEAMACERAVVVSDNGALPELVGDAGVVVPEADPRALADALGELLVDAQRRQALGEAAGRRAHSQLGVTRQAECMSMVLQDLVGGAGELQRSTQS